MALINFLFDNALRRKERVRGSLSHEKCREAARKRCPTELRWLASANGIPFTPTTPKARLLKLLRPYNQRAVVNVPLAV